MSPSTAHSLMTDFIDLGLDPKGKQILRELWLHPGASRSELSEFTEIAPSLITRQTAILIQKGLVRVRAEGQAGPQGGRRPVMLELDPGAGIVIGIEMRPSQYRVIGISLSGEPVFSLSAPYEKPKDAIPLIFLQVLAAARAKAQELGQKILGVGLGVPGIVDSDHGIIVRSNPLEIQSPLHLTEILGPAVGAPFRIEHDVRCCCWAQLLSARETGPSDFLFILGEFRRIHPLEPSFEGIALGMGLVLGKQVYAGSRHAAGEFKSVFYDTPRANEQLSIPDVVLAGLQTSDEVREIFARELGKNLALLVNVLNLPHVYIGGSVETLGEELLAILRREIEHGWQYPGQSEAQIQYTTLGDDAVAYGAGAMLLYRFFSA